MIQETLTFPLLQIKSYSFLLHLLGKVCLLHEHLKTLSGKTAFQPVPEEKEWERKEVGCVQNKNTERKEGGRRGKDGEKSPGKKDRIKDVQLKFRSPWAMSPFSFPPDSGDITGLITLLWMAGGTSFLQVVQFVDSQWYMMLTYVPLQDCCQQVQFFLFDFWLYFNLFFLSLAKASSVVWVFSIDLFYCYFTIYFTYFAQIFSICFILLPLVLISSSPRQSVCLAKLVLCCMYARLKLLFDDRDIYGLKSLLGILNPAFCKLKVAVLQFLLLIG